MAMDFFQHQEDARRNTKVLVGLFVAAVVGIILAVHLAVGLTWQYAVVSEGAAPGGASPLADPLLFGAVALGVGLLVGTGSLYKIKALGSGGEGIARRLGGRPLDPGTADPEERRLLNVVEEIAIASGVPVPPVFVLDDEEGINAFAAGTEPGNAVIGVTRGCVTWLTRDELQGVVAHEFSHILNGDMRLNLRLIGILHGILLLGLIGRIVIHGGGRGRSRKGGGWIVILGLAVLVIGYVGTFMGNLIKAAVSREREFLADASAVQFTRNPAGIAGALKKIGGLPTGSEIENPRAPEASHMYFGQGVRSRLFGWLATHPPLPERIRRIDPGFEGAFPPVERPGPAVAAAEEAGVAGLAESGAAGPTGVATAETGAGAAGGPAPGGPAAPAVEGSGLEAAMERIGRPGQEHVVHARRVLEELPAAIRSAARQKDGARALVYALLLDGDSTVRAEQRRHLEASAEPGVAERLAALEEEVRSLPAEARLPLVEVAAATLRTLSAGEYRAFRDDVETLTAADGRTRLFEWVVARFLVHHLEPHFEEERRRRARGFDNLRGLSTDLACLLSFLAWAGHDDEVGARAAFDEAVSALSGVDGLEAWPEERCTLPALEGALDHLAHLVPRLKRDVLRACAYSIAADRRVTVEEGEIFRVVGDWLECPVPPLLPGTDLAGSDAAHPPGKASARSGGRDGDGGLGPARKE